MYWEVEQLSPPGRDPDDAKTMWVTEPPTPEMKASRRPSTDYKVREEVGRNPEYVVFPDTEPLKTFRHEWILRRHWRPMVPSVEGVMMPDREKTREGRSRLFSLYLRPWVLEGSHASAHVPLLRDLSRIPVTIHEEPKRRRLAGKQRNPLLSTRSYHAAWRWYIRGHIVSRHAQRIITQFLAASCGKSTPRDASDETEP